MREPVRGLLDTSTVILLGRIADPADLPDDCVVSAVTLAELSVGPHVARTSRERAARQAHLQQAEADFEAIPFDAMTARAYLFGRRAVASHRDCDAIAAPLDLPLFTCNPDDFAGIDELRVQAVQHPDSG